MNRKATAYGYTNTAYTSVHGITASGHYTCAQELAMSAHKCYSKTFPATVGTRGSWQRIDIRAGYIWEGGLGNPGYYAGCFGSKGGSSDNVGATEGALAHTAVCTRGSVTLCAAVITNFASGGARNADVRVLFDYAFAVLGVTGLASGRIHYSNYKITYTGSGWGRSAYDTSLFSEGYAWQSATVGDKASCTGTFKTLTWRGRVGPDRGKAYCRVNGALLATVDCYSATPGAADLFTYSDTTAQPITFEIEVAAKSAASSANTIDLDYLDNTSEVEPLVETMPNKIPNKVMETSTTSAPSTTSGTTTITLGGNFAERGVRGRRQLGGADRLGEDEPTARRRTSISTKRRIPARWVDVDCTYHAGAGTLTYLRRGRSATARPVRARIRRGAAAASRASRAGRRAMPSALTCWSRAA
jgi:hypothetical protein